MANLRLFELRSRHLIATYCLVTSTGNELSRKTLSTAPLSNPTKTKSYFEGPPQATSVVIFPSKVH